MEKLKEALREAVEAGLMQMILSNPKNRDGRKKVKVRPVFIKGELYYQEESFFNNQVFHQNMNADELIMRTCFLMETEFKQAEWLSQEKQYVMLVSKKGTITVKSKNRVAQEPAAEQAASPSEQQEDDETEEKFRQFDQSLANEGEDAGEDISAEAMTAAIEQSLVEEEGAPELADYIDADDYDDEDEEEDEAAGDEEEDDEPEDDNPKTPVSGKAGMLRKTRPKKSILGPKQPKPKKQTAAWLEPDLFAHNRRKNYLLPEDEPVDFLIRLDVMAKNGKVKQDKYDKFRQINRFLEFVDDVADKLPKDRELTIIDFGCGKSYLTFALYYFLKVKQNLDVHIIGLDLKEDVIRRCNDLKTRLKYDKLEFLVGDIADYEGVSEVDMVVTLHACDTATDYALAKAVKWGAKVILSVPCCQHELNKTIENDTLAPLLKYGIIKERVAALFKDAMRAQLLEQQGYHVQLLEFIDLSHTPKNILIRAVKNKPKQQQSDAYEACRDALHADLTLEHLLQEE